MLTILKKEPHLFAIMLIPFLYLVFIYNSLPDSIPIHWNMYGEIDRYGSISELFIIACLPLIMYLIFTIAPKIDPKNKISSRSAKFHMLKSLLTVLMSILAITVIFSVKESSLNFTLITIILGLLYVILGNYYKTIKPNYFIGIRTPWTLQNETIWRATHSLASKLWFVGGLLIILLSLVIKSQNNFTVFLGITLVLILTPVLFSFIRFRKINQTTNS